MNLDRLRRWLGEPADVTAVRADLADTRRALGRCQLVLRTVRDQQRVNEARYRHTEDLNTMLVAQVAALRALAALPDEPDQAVRCKKIRLRDHDEADTFARRVEQDKDLEPNSLTAYACDDCPRQPVSLTKFWHVYNRDPDLRTYRRPAPTVHTQGLRTHVTPAVMANVKRKISGGTNG